MKSPDETKKWHPLERLLEAYKEYVISALASTPDVIQRAEALTGYSFSDDSITPEQEEIICCKREEIADGIYLCMRGYLMLPSFDPTTLNVPELHEKLVPQFKNHADDPDQFVRNLLSLTYPYCGPHTPAVWAQPVDMESIPEHLLDDACATIYNKDGTVVQISPLGTCACLDNAKLGIRLDSLAAIVKYALIGAALPLP